MIAPTPMRRQQGILSPAMKRFRRILFNLSSALALALCVAMAVLWVRSYIARDALDWGTATGRAGVDSLRGRLSFGRVIVPASARARILRGVSYRAEPYATAISTELKPGWSSWTGF